LNSALNYKLPIKTFITTVNSKDIKQRGENR